MVANVLMIGWEYPPHYSGGLGVVCQGLSQALVRNGSRVYFALPQHLDVQDEGVTFLFCGPKNAISTSTRVEEIIRELYNPYLSIEKYETLKKEYFALGGSKIPKRLIDKVDAYALQLEQVLANHSCLDDIDVIHAHDWLSYRAGIAAKKITGKPLVAHVHATEFDRGGGLGVSEEVYTREKEGFDNADHIVAVSNFTKNIIVSKYGIDPSKISVLHNALNEDDIRPGVSKLATLLEDKKVVLYLGRITIQKGVPFFLEAAKIIAEHEPEAVFVVSGSGDMEGEMKHKAQALGIADKVFFTGYANRNDANFLFGAASVFIMPSVSEPFGVVPLEAAAHNTPTIISKQSGVAEILTHSLTVDFWDTEGIANNTISILRYPALANTIVQGAKQQLKGFTWNNAVQKLDSIYKKIT